MDGFEICSLALEEEREQRIYTKSKLIISLYFTLLGFGEIFLSYSTLSDLYFMSDGFLIISIKSLIVSIGSLIVSIRSLIISIRFLLVSIRFLRDPLLTFFSILMKISIILS